MKKVSVPPSPAAKTETELPSDAAPQAVTPSVVPGAKPTPLEPAPIPKVVVAPNGLESGVISFKTGDYGKAAQAFEEYLRADSNTEGRDFVLFHLGLARAFMGNSGKNVRRAEDSLKRLVSEFPRSPYKGPAEFVLGLLGLQGQVESLKLDIKEKDTKIKQLSEELQKLKEIDMQRRPSRPLY